MEQFLIYHHYHNLSLIDSSLALLESLEIPHISEGVFKYYGGHWGFVACEKSFFAAQAYNLALAAKEGAHILALEDDAYYNLLFAKCYMDENPLLLNSLQDDLEKFSLSYNPATEVVSLNALLSNDEIMPRVESRIKRKFSQFSASVFHAGHSATHKYADFASERASLGKILSAIDLNVSYENPYFCHNESFNAPLAHKYNGKLLESAQDSGSDFVLSQSMSVFEAFDKQRKALQRGINRDLGDMSVLFLPQILLLAFGISDDSALALRYHTYRADFV